MSSTLKPNLCSWLFLHGYMSQTSKKWSKKDGRRLVYFFLSTSIFHKDSMIENMKIPLFKQETEDLALESNNNKGKEETNIEKTLDLVMEDILSRVEKLSIASATTSVVMLHGMARKRWICQDV